MRDYASEVSELLAKPIEGRPSVGAREVEGVEMRGEILQQLQSPDLDSASRSRLEAMVQDIEKELDISLEKATADQSSPLRRAGVFAQGVGKTVPAALAGAIDLGKDIYSRVTDTPKGPSASEWLESKLPLRPVNPVEEKLDTLGSVTGGGLVNSITGLGGGFANRAKDFVIGIGSEVGARTGAGVAKEIAPDQPLAQLAGALAGGAGVQALTSAPGTVRRSLAREATEGLTSSDVANMRLAQALAAKDGVQLTPGQTSGAPGFDGLRNMENYAAQRSGSKVREMQVPQEGQAMARGRQLVDEMPGQVGTRESIARQGRDVAAAEINRITSLAQNAYRRALQANGGKIPRKQIAALDKQLRAVMRDPRRANMPGMAETISELRSNLYKQTKIQDVEIIPGRNELDAITGQKETITYPEAVTVERTVKTPISDIEELRGIQDRAQPSFKDSGIGNLNPTTRKQQAMVRATTDKAISSAVPAVAEAKSAMKGVFQRENFGVKKSANSLGGWVPKKGITDDAAAPEAMLAKLMDRGIEPGVPKTQSPPIRFAAQLGTHPKAAEFFGNMVKTKVSEVLSKAARAGDEAGEGFSGKVYSELASPAKARARRDMVEAWAITSGKTPAEGRQMAQGLENFLETLRAIERKAPQSKRLPMFNPEQNLESIGMEGLAASQYRPRIASFISKYSGGFVTAGGQRWIDEQLTTPGGVEFLMKYAKQNPGTDAAKGMVMGLLTDYQTQNENSP